jgi:NNP family nitrate/nitrite transporter-like MFS transporter
MANGGTYSIVPFVNKDAIGSVAGIVGAGGNIGAMLIGFLFKSKNITYSQAFFYIGIGVAVVGLVVLLAHLRISQKAEVATKMEDEAALVRA